MHRHFIPVPVWLESDAVVVWILAHESKGAQPWQASNRMEEYPNGGEALGEEAVSNCRREEQILPLLQMENIPSWKLSWAPSCSSLIFHGKIPLGFCGKICSQWVDGSPVRFKLIFWVRKRGETSHCSACSQCGKGKKPPKHSARRSPVLVGWPWCDLVTPLCHEMGFIVGRYVNQTINRFFGCPSQRRWRGTFPSMPGLSLNSPP